MRARLVTLAAVSVALLAACGGSADDSATAPATTPASIAEETATPTRTVDPEAPDSAVLAESDDMGHRACELWMSALEEGEDLREVAEDVAWHLRQADNEFVSGPLTGDNWVENSPEQVRIFCSWNGYEVEVESPADLLG